MMTQSQQTHALRAWEHYLNPFVKRNDSEWTQAEVQALHGEMSMVAPGGKVDWRFVADMIARK